MRVLEDATHASLIKDALPANLPSSNFSLHRILKNRSILLPSTHPVTHNPVNGAQGIKMKPTSSSQWKWNPSEIISQPFAPSLYQRASLALMVYRGTISAGVVPTMEIFSQVLGCLQLPPDAPLRNNLVENLEVSTDSPKRSTLYSLVDGFGEYDPRAFSLFEGAASRVIIPCVSFKEVPIVVDATELSVHTATVYLLTVLKGLKNQLAAGAKLPPTGSIQIQSPAGKKVISVAGRIGQAVAAMLRRLGLAYKGMNYPRKSVYLVWLRKGGYSQNLLIHSVGKE